MKPSPLALTLAVAAVLAGCSGEGASPGAAPTGAPTAAATPVPAVQGPAPGLYRTTVTMTGLSIKGLPEGHGAGLTTTREDCLTPAALEKGYEELVKKGQNGECSYERFAAAGGKIAAVLVCRAEGRTSRIAMSGTTSDTGAELNAETAMEFEGMGKGTMTFTTKHERIGDCAAPPPPK